ncbi:GNAT family N-acetyltransferase [Methyloversatilis discipulorum]|jgi:putative hemolysin|uniref:GNAT family N-acetyltransferase n=1 Tax=Methyloversatilis discipulorum TaxID=1119528 RepID=UPI00036146E2|nr:GNAT family N-acyltransferase [Methyloversatilis discipulorum]
MLQIDSARERRAQRNLSVTLAACESEVLAAQQLRWRVFADELGARLDSPVHGADIDRFDAHCKHLIVRDEDNGRIVGCYRILPPEAARRTGGYYSETEFDLGRLDHLRSQMVEIGRSCIDADYRNNAAVIALLWSGLARYMLDGGHQYLIGCASIGLADGGHNAAAIWAGLSAHMAPAEYRVFPKVRLPLERLTPNASSVLPPLVKGYIRAGAEVCGEPAWDPDFNTADLPLLLTMAKLDARYARHFVQRAA